MQRKRIITAIAGVAALASVGTAVAGNQPIRPFGTITASGGDTIEVDGYSNSPLTEAHPWAGGYISIGMREAGGDPGICVSGENNRAYYHQAGHEGWQDCNAAIVDEENVGYLTDALTGG